MKKPRIKFGLGSIFFTIVIAALVFGWWQDRQYQRQPLYLHIIQPTYYGSAASPPKRVVSVEIRPNSSFNIDFQDGRYVRGKLATSVTQNHRLTLSVNFQASYTFDGPVELDTAYDPQLYVINSVVFMQKFFISSSPEPQTMLDKQAELDKQDLQPATSGQP